MKEIWRDVKGWEGLYKVSNIGNVESLGRKKGNRWGTKSKLKGRILRQTIVGGGYHSVVLCRDGVEQRCPTHRLVAMAFIERDKEERIYINHINGIKTDNRVENLEWCTIKENNFHTRFFDFAKRKEKKILTKIDISLVEIFRHIRQMSHKDIGFQFGVSKELIAGILKNRRYKEVDRTFKAK